MRAMRGIHNFRRLERGLAALLDFYVCMNILHRGLCHNTYPCHLPALAQVCETAMIANEASSVVAAKELYKDFLNPTGNIDVVYNGSCMTCGCRSHIGVGCIIELHIGLVIDHMVLCNFCLGRALGPSPSDDACNVWLASHKCQVNRKCNSGRMEVNAALMIISEINRKTQPPLHHCALGW